MSDQQLTTYDAPIGNPMALMPRNQVDALNLAKMIADSTLIPDHLRKKPSDCLMVVMQAYRWGMDPFAVAQCTSVVHNRLCYEGKLVAAALYARGAVVGRLRYAITGEGQDSAITVTGTPSGGDGEVSISGTVKGWRTFQYAKGADGKADKTRTIPNNWDNDAHSMLVYRGTRQWARIYCPEVMLGVNTPDEFDGDEPERITVTPDPLPRRDPPLAAASNPAGFEQPKTKPGPDPKAAPAPIEGEFVPAQTGSAAPAAAQAPFDDPTAATPAPAAAAPQGEFRLPACGDGEPLSAGMARILETKCKAAGVSSAKLATKFPAVNKGNLNTVLEWAQNGAAE